MKQKIVRVIRRSVSQQYAQKLEMTYRQNLAKLVSYRGGVSVHKLRVFVVVGAVGKRTTALFLKKMLQSCGRSVAVLYAVNDKPLEAKHVQRFLKQSKKDAIECVILALNFSDLRLCSLGTVLPEVTIMCPMEGASEREQRVTEYFLKENPATHILRKHDDAIAASIFEREDVQNEITYGLSDEADIKALDITPFAKGTEFQLVADTQTTIELATHLIGAHNVENCLAAFGASYIAGEDIEKTVEGIVELEQVQANLQRIETGPHLTYIDSGLSRHGLHRVIDSVLPLKKSRVIIVTSHRLLDEELIMRINKEAARCIILGQHANAARSVNAQHFFDAKTAIVRGLETSLPADILIIVGDEFTQLDAENLTLAEKVIAETIDMESK